MKILNKIKILTVIILSAITFSACSMITPVNATDNEVGTKVGSSGGGMFLGIYFDIDASIKEAAKQGAITKISTVEFRYTNLLGVYQEYTCIVTGE